MITPRILGMGAACGAVLALTATLSAATADEGYTKIQLTNPEFAVSAYQRDGRISTLFGGQPFSAGATPDQSAEAFIHDNMHLFMSDAEDLKAIGPFENGQHLLPTGYDRATNTFKYTLVGYTQFRNDIPVFRGSLTLMVRNVDNFPLVMATNGLREIGNFQPDLNGVPQASREQNGKTADQLFPNLDRSSAGRLVIWAGVNDDFVAPVLAREFIAEGGSIDDASYEKYLILADARTGAILYSENQVLSVDVEGNTSGMATQGVASDQCEDEALEPLPYLRVNIGGTQVFADANGDFVIPNGGNNDVTVVSPMTGEWFFVDNEQGGEETINMVVTPPGPANFVHNEANNQEFIRSQSNGYLQANIIRDYALFYNPAFPTIGTQTGFEINVNRSATCNATYSGPSINFYASGGGCPNTAFSTIVHHEYGHHIVAVSNSGSQGAYGEGYGDVMGVLVTDDPGLAYGFFGNCNSPLRNADSNIQYPCVGEIHACGVLIAACVWDTREELVVSEPSDYIDILGDIVFNAMPMHAGLGSEITPAITVHYLMADDDDGNIENGTPHYNEIANGFGAHNMDAPPLALIGFEFPDGIPDLTSPDGSTSIGVNVVDVTGEAQSGTGVLHFDDGDGVVDVPMSEGAANEYIATFPTADCGSPVTFYFSAEAVGGQVQFSPIGAPGVRYGAVAATGVNIAVVEDFESDNGWTFEHVDTQDGQFERGVPAGGGGRGDPANDFDGSGNCLLTDNVSGNSDVDGGPTRAISPDYDLSAMPNAFVEYARWFTNDDLDADAMDIHVSDDGGGSWTLVESVGNQVGWTKQGFRVADYVDTTSTVRIRFSATDNPNDSVTEAGIDAVNIVEYLCDEDCAEDLDGNGAVDFGDVLEILAAWGNAGGPEDLDGSGTVDFGDINEVLAAWGPC